MRLLDHRYRTDPRLELNRSGGREDDGYLIQALFEPPADCEETVTFSTSWSSIKSNRVLTSSGFNVMNSNPHAL